MATSEHIWHWKYLACLTCLLITHGVGAQECTIAKRSLQYCKCCYCTRFCFTSCDPCYSGNIEVATCTGNSSLINLANNATAANNVEALILTGADLEEIPSFLCNFNNLEYLDMSYNYLQQTDMTPIGCLQKLKSLKLHHMNLTRVELDDFNKMKDLLCLDLSHNHIHDVEYLEKGFENLRFFDLSWNYLTILDHWAFQMRSLEYLDVSHNKLYHVPSSDYQGRLHVNVTDNQFQYIPKTLSNQYSPTVKELKQTIWEGQELCFQMKNNHLICDCQQYGIIKPIIELIMVLQKSLLSIEGKICNKFSSPDYTCKSPSKFAGKNILAISSGEYLEQCSLNCSFASPCLCQRNPANIHETLVICDGKNLTQMPQMLPAGNLNINISHNFVEHIPDRPYWDRVKVFNATFNNIKTIDIEVWKKLSSALLLDLRHNKIKRLPSEIQQINSSNVKHQQTILLHQNPIACDCEAAWMPSWMKDNDRIIGLSTLTCDGLNTSKPIIQFSKNELCGYSSLDLVIIFTTGGGILIIVIILGILSYKYKGTLKAIIYAKTGIRIKNRNQIVPDDGLNYEFDVFVCYPCSTYLNMGDMLDLGKNIGEDFALKILIPYLRNSNLNVYWEEGPDFPVGGCHAEDLVEGFKKSRQTILIISKHLVNSELYNEYVFAQAYLCCGSKRLYPILLDDMSLEDIGQDSELGKYLKMYTYLDAKEYFFWEKFMYAFNIKKRMA